jgi:hypothetical protein
MDEAQKADRSAWWIALAGTVGAVVGTVITGGVDYFDHKGDIDTKMIELSIDILRAQPTPETIPLREWAINTIEKRGDFSFSPEQVAVLRKQQLPHLSSQIGQAVSSAIRAPP